MDFFDTICALATPAGNGGIAVVRMSGKDSLSILNAIFKTKDKITPRYMHYGVLVENEIMQDEVMAVYFLSPNSYTGEDMAEVHVHGGHMPYKKCLELMIKQGARLAEPGEFSKRAFLNGKMDLTKAEAVMDLISASSELQAVNALFSLRGRLRQNITDIADKLSDALSYIEALIEYPEEDFSPELNENLLNDLNAIAKKIANLIATYKQGSIIKNGFRVAIVGKPNVGKSSLLNALLFDERAIVTDIAGTTRDVLTGECEINGLLVCFYDTAGLRESDDYIEKLGIEKTRQVIEDAHLVLYVTDVLSGIAPDEVKFISSLKDVLPVINKIDLDCDYNFVHPDILPEKIIHLSAKTNHNLDKLRQCIYDYAVLNQTDSCVISNERHLSALSSALSSLDNAIDSLVENIPHDLLAIDIRDSLNYMGEITGSTVGEDIIDKIFSNFCLGK